MAGASELLSHRVASLLNRVTDERELSSALTTILDTILPSIGASGGAIRVYEGQDKSDITLNTNTGAAQYCFDNFDVEDCVCGAALQEDNGRMFVSSDISKTFCQEKGYANIACCSKKADGVNTVLFLAGYDAQIQPEAEAMETVEQTLEDIANTAKRLHMARQDRQRAQDMETVNKIGRVITSRLKLKEMVREIIATIGSVLETDEVNVILFDEARCELSFLARYFSDGSDLDQPEVYPLSDGINSWIIKNRQSLLMRYDTLTECEKLGIRHGGQPAKSWLGSPMIYKGKVTGVLSVQSYGKTALYDENSTALIEAVANQCAVAVENARLFEEVIKREEDKERLYFSLTHDLLSLVNPVSGFARILKSVSPEADSSSFEKIVENIISATDKITRFAEDILVYAKIKSGKLALDISRGNIFTTLDSAIKTYIPELELRNIVMTVNGREISLDTPLIGEVMDADMDRAQMERVFINCIGNAIKHTNTRIDIELSKKGKRIHCKIVDDGDGAPADVCETLFEEFYQAKTNGVTKKGVGLGLPTVKRIIELHEGVICAESSPGEGFGIEFSWPRTLADREGM